MRGKHRSFALADVVREAQLLELQGAREVNLVAQDLAHYGRDRRDGVGLPELLEALVAETGIPWIRMLYLYSAGLTPTLLERMAGEPRILRYLDMPMQHASDAVLKRMRRPERQDTQRQRIQRIRDVVPDVAIRTTCIVGFPGETEDDFQQLLDFLEETRFDRVGAFTYSAQEGTRAWALPDDVPEDVKRERLERLTELQRVITAERYDAHIGSRVRVLVDAAADATGRAQARAPWQADDVDGVTRVMTDAMPGDFVDVEIDAVEDDYDFAATALHIVDRFVDRYRPARPPRMGRVLPVTTAGSFGR
jgi:ribosomal protein S12 methylthiotransferase